MATKTNPRRTARITAKRLGRAGIDTLAATVTAPRLPRDRY